MSVTGNITISQDALKVLVKEAVEQAVTAVGTANRAPTAPNFMADLSLANDAPWDYTSNNGVKIYMAAIAPLPAIFDGTEAKLNAFLNAIFLRAESLGFEHVFSIEDANGVKRSLIEEYGCLTLQDVKTQATTPMRTET